MQILRILITKIKLGSHMPAPVKKENNLSLIIIRIVIKVPLAFLFRPEIKCIT